MAERFPSAVYGLREAAEILGVSAAAFRRAAERYAKDAGTPGRFVADGILGERLRRRWRFRFDQRWLADGQPLRWRSPKAAAKTLRRSRVALTAALRRAAHVGSSGTTQVVVGLRVAKFGTRWRVARDHDHVGGVSSSPRRDDLPPKALSSLDTNELTRPSRETCARWST